MKRDLVIFGAGGFAEIAHYYFSHDSNYRVQAFCVDGEFAREESFLGLPVLAKEELSAATKPHDGDIFVALGIKQRNEVRQRKCEWVLEQGYRLASQVSSHAIVPVGFAAGPNTMIMDGTIIHPSVHIGANCIIWNGCMIAIRSVVEDHCWIVTATIGEQARIGHHSFLALESAVAPRVKMGAYNLIGTGARVLRDTSDNAVFKPCTHVPARADSRRVAHLFI